MINALGDFTLKILLVCAVVTIILETATASESKRPIAWIDGFAIFIAVFVCTSVTAGNDYQKERQFQQLNKVANDKKMVNYNINYIIKKKIIIFSFKFLLKILYLQNCRFQSCEMANYKTSIIQWY